MLVFAYATSLEEAKWSGARQLRWEENDFNFHSVTCYTNSIVSRIHVNTTKLRNIMRTLVATCVILRSLLNTTNGADSHGVPSPTFECRETLKIVLGWNKSRILIILWKNYSWDMCLERVGCSILRAPTLYTSPQPRLQKALSCRRPSHNLGPVWSDKSQLPHSQRLRLLHGVTSSDLGFRT